MDEKAAHSYPARVETLRLPPALVGGVWAYRYRGPSAWQHRHAELELNLVTRGWGRYLVGERRHDLRPGTLIWLYPAESHLLVDAAADFEMWIAVFRPELVERVCTTAETRPLSGRLPAGLISKRLLPDDQARLTRLLAETAELTAEVDLFNAALGYLLLIAWQAHQRAETALPGPGAGSGASSGGGGGGGAGIDLHPAVERAVRLIRAGEDDHSVDHLAQRCGLSPTRLSRLFKAQVGVSLGDFRQRQRLERFLALYGRGRRRTLMQAALEAGFGSYPQFHRVFRRWMGRTPAAYRQSMASEAGDHP